MRLVLVRHGETPWNREGRFQGQSPVGLSQQGLAQSRQVAKALLPMKATALYSSPLPRTMMTAQEMRTQHAQVYAAWRADPSGVVFPGGESIRQLQERAWRAVQEMEKAHPEDVVVAVSHNFAIRAIICRFLRLPLSRFRLLRVDLASISILQYRSRFRQAVTINERCHLSQDGLQDA